MTLDQVERQLKPHLAALRSLNARAKLDFSPEGVLLIDATRSPVTLCRGEGHADTVIRMSLADFHRLIERRLDPGEALSSGALRIGGSIALAVRLGRLLARAADG